VELRRAWTTLPLLKVPSASAILEASSKCFLHTDCQWGSVSAKSYWVQARARFLAILAEFAIPQHVEFRHVVFIASLSSDCCYLVVGFPIQPFDMHFAD
jgi:hypothetical protein